MKEIITYRLALEKMLKWILHVEMKGHKIVTLDVWGNKDLGNKDKNKKNLFIILIVFCKHHFLLSTWFKRLIFFKLYFKEVGMLVTQSCLTLCDPVDYSPQGSFTHGVFQTRILEWVAMPDSGSGRFPGEGHGNPLQYSCLEFYILKVSLKVNYSYRSDVNISK